MCTFERKIGKQAFKNKLAQFEKKSKFFNILWHFQPILLRKIFSQKICLRKQIYLKTFTKLPRLPPPVYFETTIMKFALQPHLKPTKVPWNTWISVIFVWTSRGPTLRPSHKPQNVNKLRNNNCLSSAVAIYTNVVMTGWQGCFREASAKTDFLKKPFFF